MTVLIIYFEILMCSVGVLPHLAMFTKCKGYFASYVFSTKHVNSFYFLMELFKSSQTNLSTFKPRNIQSNSIINIFEPNSCHTLCYLENFSRYNIHIDYLIYSWIFTLLTISRISKMTSKRSFCEIIYYWHLGDFIYCMHFASLYFWSALTRFWRLLQT